MRIIQLIDSLDAGGAEKMAVNYANSLAAEIAFSGLVTTRKEGVLRNDIDPKVSYLFLDKKGRVDFTAVTKLRKYCKDHQVQFVHAHGTSFFTGFLLKLMMPSIKLIWHDHNGDRNTQHRYSNKILWLSSQFFTGIIVVNQKLKNWTQKNLGCKYVTYLPNYTVFDSAPNVQTALLGAEGKRILHLANLRNPKNHLLLVAVAEKVQKSHPDWTFHLVGNDAKDSYSDALKAKIKALQLDKTVYIYGQKNDIGNIIAQSAIAVLCSTYEGLPVALLEYGMNAKPVVVTNVGEMPLIVKNDDNGFVVPSENADAFYNALTHFMDSSELRNRLGAALQKAILRDNSENAVIAKYLSWLEETKKTRNS